jgi:LPS sulfotransferase NodH
MPAERGSYLLCTTPRTGSTWLCGLLESTGVAGRPASYFRQAEESRFADEWGIRRIPDGAVPYGEFVQAALAAGKSDNGVFGARIMWGTMVEVVDRLGPLHPVLQGRDLELLDRVFGRPRFLSLRRLDVVAQAVSLFRAEQTDVWHTTDRLGKSERKQGLHYELETIHDLVRMIEVHNVAWEQWFATVGVRPHSVLYEDLEGDPFEVTQGILAFLGLELPQGRQIVGRHERLSDQLSTEWIDRYRAQAGTKSGFRGTPA